jgi:hypothetical protein
VERAARAAGAAILRALRAIFLFALALALGYAAGWQFPADGLAVPAGVASASSLLMALA